MAMFTTSGSYSLSQGATPSGIAMADKLYQLKKHEYESRGSSEVCSISEVESGSASQPPAYTETEEHIGDFLGTVEILNDEISQIDDLVVKIANNHTVILSSHQNDHAKTQNEKHHEQVKMLAKHVTDELKKIKNALDEEASGSDRHSADLRIRRAQYNTIAKRFRETMMKVSDEEESYRQKNKDVLQRQLRITGQFQTEEKVEEILDQENPQVFMENIMGRYDQRMLNEVENRHQEVKRLEENINELQDMFLALHQLVYEQGDLVNQIEYNVDKAANYVDKGRQKTREVKEIKQKNNNLKLVICCVVSSVTIVLVILVIIVVAAVGYFVFGRN